MQFTTTRFRIDPTPRRADDGYIAHARITSSRANGDEFDVHLSGDLAGFGLRDDAIRYANDWAQQWLHAQFG